MLFLGFALMAGGLAGSVVGVSWCPPYGRWLGDVICFVNWYLQTVLVLKYVVPKYPFPTLYFGVANVIANGLIMLRYVGPHVGYACYC